jgi:hypothetical protein
MGIVACNMDFFKWWWDHRSWLDYVLVAGLILSILLDVALQK